MIQNKQGFTLIELMVVITIIGILAGLGMPMLQKQLFKGHLEEAKPYLMLIASRMRTYKKERGTYILTGYNLSEASLEESLGIDLKDAGNFCFTVTAKDPADAAPTPYAFTNDLAETDFEIWAILRDETNLNPASDLGSQPTCASQAAPDKKNAPEDWSTGYAGRTVVLRYPPGSNEVQYDVGTDIIHDWVNGISIYDAVKD